MTANVRDSTFFNKNQHCTNEDCYTFSHTAEWCGNDQPRFCLCPFDYSKDLHDLLEEEQS